MQGPRQFIAAAVIAATSGMASLPVQAQDFTVTKSVANGTFTLTNNSSVYSATELVVEGLGLSAGTTLAGWSAASFLFSDPLNCLPALNSSITQGFCYLLTDTSAGAAIGHTTVTFSYDSSFDDQSLPSNFALLFLGPGGAVGGCTGTTDTGCSITAVPEPATVWTWMLGLCAFAAGRRWRSPLPPA